MLKYFLLTLLIDRQAGCDRKRVERRIWRSGYKLVLLLAERPEGVLDDINGILASHGCRCKTVPGNFGDDGREYAGVPGKADVPFWSIGDMMHAAPELCEGIYSTWHGVCGDRVWKILGKCDMRSCKR